MTACIHNTYIAAPAGAPPGAYGPGDRKGGSQPGDYVPLKTGATRPPNRGEK